MTAPISNGPTTHGYTTMRDATEKFFTEPHSTSRRGGFSFIPVRSIPHKRDKIRPARLHQRPRATKFAQRTQNTPKSAFFRLQGELFRGSDQNPLQLGELFRADGATAASQHLPTALPETDDTNAGGSLPQDETAGTSASSLPHTFVTTDTFARTKRPFSGHFPPAKVSRVSCTRTGCYAHSPNRA